MYMKQCTKCIGSKKCISISRLGWKKKKIIVLTYPEQMLSERSTVNVFSNFGRNNCDTGSGCSGRTKNLRLNFNEFGKLDNI